jgi:hypothetical protein
VYETGYVMVWKKLDWSLSLPLSLRSGSSLSDDKAVSRVSRAEEEASIEGEGERVRVGGGELDECCMTVEKREMLP